MRTTRLLTVSRSFLGGWKGEDVYPSMNWAGECVYPSMHWAGGCLPRGCLSGGCLPRGVSAQGGRGCMPKGRGCLPRGCLPKGTGGVCAGGLSAQGVSASGTRGVCSRHPPPWTDRHLWKHNLRKLRLRAVINVFFWLYGPFWGSWAFLLYCYDSRNATQFYCCLTEFANNTVHEEHTILLYRRHHTMVAYEKIYFEA